MSTLSPRPDPSPHVSWGIAIAAGAMLLIGGGAMIWSSQDSGPEFQGPPLAAESPSDQVAVLKRELPNAPPSASLHSIAYTMENGTRVVKIKVLETGDELIVDAATGRLLEARPNRPTAPPPAGRFAAPFQPMT